MLTPVFGMLEAEGKIGDLVIDVGCGAVPVTGLLKATTARKRILVDIASDNAESAEAIGIRLDAEEAGRREGLACRKALLRACAFLAISPRTEPRTELADTIVFSEVLNYVDFRKVIQGFSVFLKPGGRIIVINLPFRGNASLFSEKGLKENRQLYEFLDEHDFEIEFKAFPKRPARETDESQEFLLLVAQKPFRSNRIGARSC
ncbi:MAG: class I SAM-dependent methyltransferase [Opitutaceae bacterium]